MKKSLFYKIYFAVVALFVVALTVGLFVFSGWLEKYEAGQPENLVESTIEAYIKNGSFCEMRDNAGLLLSKYETEDSVKNFFETTVKDKEITYSSISKRVEGSDLGFGISADGQKFMNLYLKKASGGGYELTCAEFEETIYKEIKITAPANAEISVNGKPLEQELRSDLVAPAISESYLSGEIIKKQFATVSNLIGSTPLVTSGEGFTVTADDGGIYAITLSAEDPDGAAIEAFAVEAAKTYSCYLQKDSSVAALRQYLATDTEFYKNVSTSYITYVAEHVSYRFDDVSVSELHKFSDNLYSCRIKMTHVIVSKTGEEHNDYFDKYVYVYKSGNSLKAVDMQIYGGGAGE